MTWLSALPALAITLTGIVMAFVAFYWPPERGQMAVVFPPGTGQQAGISAIVSAGGRFVASTQIDNVLVAFAETDNFIARVRDKGALFVLAGRGMCGPQTDQVHT